MLPLQPCQSSTVPHCRWAFCGGTGRLYRAPLRYALAKPFVNLQAPIKVMNVCRGFSATPHKSENSSSIAHHLALDRQSPTPQLEVLHIGWMASIMKWTLWSEGEKTATLALRSLVGTSTLAVCTCREDLHPSPKLRACRPKHAPGHRCLDEHSANPIPNSRA